MAEPSTHINYSFEDIQRYLQGKMSAAEMHAVEKAALQDPFLADAIEGYTTTDAGIAQQHLNEINAGLFAEKQKSKVVAFHKKTQWLNVAAIVIVLAGIGVVLSYFLRTPNQQTQIAQTKNEPVKNESPKDLTKDNVSTFTQKPDTALLIAENKSFKKANPLSAKKYNAKKGNQTIVTVQEDERDAATINAAPLQQNEVVSKSPGYTSTGKDEIVPQSSSSNLMALDTAQFDLRSRSAASNALTKTFSGKVLDANGDPIPFAALQLNEKKSIIADAEGNFRVQDDNSSLSVIVSGIGYNSKNLSLIPFAQNIITLNRSSSSLSDVVVTTALGVSKKATSSSDSAMPVGGWQNFNHYVARQLNTDTTINDITNPNDLVEMEFLIDKTGNPYNIKVIRPLDEERNTKAIEILRSGPKWTNPSKNKKAKVAINF